MMMQFDSYQAPQTQRQVTPIINTERTALTNILTYTASPLNYTRNAMRLRIADLFSLSTHNLYQAYLIQLAFPEFHQPRYSANDFNHLNRDARIRSAAEQFIQSLREIETNNSDDIFIPLRSTLYRFYQTASYPYAMAGSSPGDDDDSNPGNDDTYVAAAGSAPGGDDLPTIIARELAHIYYLNLEITLDDVKICIQNKCQAAQFDIQQIDKEFIRKIKTTQIDDGRMELRTLLPSDDIIEVAVAQLQQPHLISRAKTWFTELLNWFFNSKSTNSENDSHDPNLNKYKEIVAKTLDKYISWWKMSWFGHHHDARARAVREEILAANSSSIIQNILERQKRMVDPDFPVTQLNQPLPVQNWRDLEKNDRWNNPRKVVNHKQSITKSGFYRVVDEAYNVDPKDPVFKP